MPGKTYHGPELNANRHPLIPRTNLILRLACALWFALNAAGPLVGQEVPAYANESSSTAKEPSEAESLPLPIPEQYIALDLMAVEQLILMLSNRPDQEGATQEALVFLGRAPQRGWEAIGMNDVEELRSHWRSVAGRLLTPYTHSELSLEKKEKIELAVEISINQFVRLYSSLRTDFMEQTDQKARLALITSDRRYEQLRQLGREGLFQKNSLVGRAIHTLLTRED